MLTMKQSNKPSSEERGNQREFELKEEALQNVAGGGIEISDDDYPSMICPWCGAHMYKTSNVDYFACSRCHYQSNK